MSRKQRTRKNRADSTEFAADEIVNSALPDPPAHVKLLKEDMPFFQSVIAEFTRAEWTHHQLEIAGFLARAMADHDREQRLLRKEGMVIKNEKNFSYVNPRKGVLQSLSNMILALRRSLCLNVRARDGDSRDTATRRAAARTIRDGVKHVEDDPLIPKRKVH